MKLYNNYVKSTSFMNCNIFQAIYNGVKYFLYHKVWLRWLCRYKGRIFNEFSYRWLFYNFHIFRKNHFPYRIEIIKDWEVLGNDKWTKNRIIIEHFKIDKKLFDEVYKFYNN